MEIIFDDKASSLKYCIKLKTKIDEVNGLRRDNAKVYVDEEESLSIIKIRRANDFYFYFPDEL